jgi:hypothetical protein
MSVNKYRPHVYLVPEDEANRQLALGFLNHEAVNEAIVYVRSPAGGWRKALEVYDSEYLPLLRRWPEAHVIILIDFDGDLNRRVEFEQRTADDVKSRVFVIGSRDEPETLKGELKTSLEQIGNQLAQDCLADDLGLWLHPHLVHNNTEVHRMVQAIKPIVFH